MVHSPLSEPDVGPEKSVKHKNMQATVEDVEDVDLVHDVSTKENESLFEEVIIRDLPATEVPSVRANTATTSELEPWLELSNPATLLPTMDEMLSRKENAKSAEDILLRCRNCKKLESSAHAFTKCPFCKAVVYCGKACKKQDHKRHKKECGQLANEVAKLSSLNLEIVQEQRAVPPRVLGANLRLVLKTLSTREAMEYWIDAFRLSKAAERAAVSTHQVTNDCQIVPFKKFLRALKQRDKDWAPWLWEKKGWKDCLKLAKDKESWFWIGRLVTAQELKQHSNIPVDYISILSQLKKVIEGEII